MNKELKLYSDGKKIKTMTTKELAEYLGCYPQTITDNAKICLPNKEIINGKTTQWTEAEVTILIEHIKHNNPNQSDLMSSTLGIETTLTPLLKAAKLRDQIHKLDSDIEKRAAIAASMELLNEMLAEAIKSAENANEAMDKLLDNRGNINFQVMAGILAKEGMNIGRNKLFDLLKEKEILMDTNIPYRKYIELGFFVITNKETPIGLKSVTLITPRGQDYIMKLLIRKEE
jgi:phage antirepressor YoqD-like protein